MKRQMLLLALALGVAGLVPTAHAQTRSAPATVQNFTQYYNIDSLMTRPGVITLGKGGMVFLDFPDNVSAIITPQSAMLDIPDPLGNLVVLTAKVSTGEAQILIQLENGLYAAWKVNFTPGMTGLKRIKIDNTPTVDVAQPAVQTSLPAAAPAAGMPIFLPKSVLPASPVLPALGEQTSLSAPVVPLTRNQPLWLSADAVVNRAERGNTLSITVTNNGPRSLMFEPQDLTVSLGGTPQNVEGPGVLTVASGKSSTYTVALPASADTGTVRVEWLGYDQASQTYYRLSK